MGIPATLSSVPAQTPYIQYVATSGQTVFPYPFEITQDSDLVVVYNGTTYNTDSGYSVSGVGNSTGGNITLSTGASTGDIVTLYRDIPIERLTQFAQNGGFSSTAFNAEFNNVYLLLQQLQQNIDQCLQIPNINSPAPVTTLMPANYANKYLAFDANGNPEPADLTSSGSLTASILGGLLYPKSAAETAAAVSPASLAYDYDRLERFGVATGNTDNLSELNTAYLPGIQPQLNVQRRFVKVQPDSYVVSAAPTNPYGIDVAANGAALMEQFTVTGTDAGTYYRQINSYANNQAGPYLIGKEYLYHLYNKLIAGGTGIGVHCYGDSRIAGGNGESSKLLVQNLLPNLGYWAGLPQPLNVTNNAVGGTDWEGFSSTSVTTDVNSGNVDLMFIGYGYNDGSLTYDTRLSQLATTMRTQLAAIRALSNGSLNKLSIVLIGPLSGSDTPTQRDEYWLEQVRNVYVQAARDYQCVYFDSYAYLQDSRHANGWDMDNVYSDTAGQGRAIHPLNERILWWWPAMFRSIFGWDETRFLAYNNFQNLSGNWTAGNTTAATAPASYGFGISLYRAASANGFPYDGVLMNVQQADGATLQMLFPFASASRTVVAKRLAYVGGNSWTPWTGVPNDMTSLLANSWVAYGSSFDGPTYTLGDDNMVTVCGLIKSGTVTAGTTIATLPAGYRPPNIAGMFIQGTNAGSCLIKVDTSGNIILQTTGDATFTSLNFRFRAA